MDFVSEFFISYKFLVIYMEKHGELELSEKVEWQGSCAYGLLIMS